MEALIALELYVQIDSDYEHIRKTKSTIINKF